MRTQADALIVRARRILATHRYHAKFEAGAVSVCRGKGSQTKREGGVMNEPIEIVLVQPLDSGHSVDVRLVRCRLLKTVLRREKRIRIEEAKSEQNE